jgi:hypothetical protein
MKPAVWIAVILFPVLGVVALVAPYTHTAEAAPSAPRTLLVAVDLASGSTRGVRVTESEEDCLGRVKMAAESETFRSEYLHVSEVERLECRAPR